jgi:hypothetical protein
MRVPIANVPLHLQRRAAKLLDSLRGICTEGLHEAKLADEVMPIHRTDVHGVAYYEFAIERPSGKRSGFIIISTGEHDYPHAHFSARKPPVSDELLQRAKGDVACIYRFDALGYVAVDERGREAARVRMVLGKPRREQTRRAWELTGQA